MIDKKIAVKNIFSKYCSSEQSLENFTSLFIEKHYKKGDYILCEGQRSDNFGFVFSGVVRKFIIDEEGTEAVFRFLTEGDLISGSLGYNLISDIYLQCIEDTVIFSATWEELIKFTSNNRWFQEFYNRYVGDFYTCNTKRLTSYIRLTAKERYISFVDKNPDLLNRIPHYMIASYLGITPIQLSRIRKSLEKK